MGFMVQSHLRTWGNWVSFTSSPFGSCEYSYWPGVLHFLLRPVFRRRALSVDTSLIRCKCRNKILLYPRSGCDAGAEDEVIQPGGRSLRPRKINCSYY